jgi:hypothetical protein
MASGTLCRVAAVIADVSDLTRAARYKFPEDNCSETPLKGSCLSAVL